MLYISHSVYFDLGAPVWVSKFNEFIFFSLREAIDRTSCNVHAIFVCSTRSDF